MNYLCCAIACIISCVRWFNPRCTKVWGHNTHQNNERWIALVENGQQTSETAKLTISSKLSQVVRK